MASACDRLAAPRMTRNGSKSPCARIFSRVSAVEKQTRAGSGSARGSGLEPRDDATMSAMKKSMPQGWRGDNEWAMNIANMRGYFQIASLAKPFLPARRALGTILACLSGMVLTAPVLGLVGPAREAPEFAPYVVTVLDKSAGGANFCTASVIAPNVVLTAAHCVSNLSNTRVFFQGGHSQLVFF